MKLRDIVDQVYQSTPMDERVNFSRSYHIRRLNQLIRRVLERGQAWIEFDATGVEITTGNQSIALPTNMIGNQIIAFEFRESSGDEEIVNLDQVDYVDIFAVTATSAAPTKFAIHNKTFYIDSLADKDYTVYSKYYRTLSSDLTEDQVVENIVTPFRQELHIEFETFYLTTLGADSLSFMKLMDEWIDTVMIPAFHKDYISDKNFKSRFDGILEY